MFNSKKNLEILRKAFDIIAREEAKSLPTPEECTHVTFSEEFEQKMQKLINKEKKPYYYLINTVGKRVACVIIAVLLALTSVTFGVKAIREAVIDFFVETFEKFSIVGFKDEDISCTLDHIETYYAPTYIPEGYVLKTDEKFKTYRKIEYISAENDYIYFKQRIIDNSDTYVDTEDANFEIVCSNDIEFFYTSKDRMQMVYWNDSEYHYLITSENNLSIEELNKIVQSVN